MIAEPDYHEEMSETFSHTLKITGPNCYIPIEEFPRRIDFEKLITNLIRTSIYEEGQTKTKVPSKLFLLIQNETPDLTLLRELLPEIHTIKCFDDYWELLQFIGNETEDFFLAITSINRLKIAPHMNISSRSHYRKFLQRAFDSNGEKFLYECLKKTEKDLQSELDNYSSTSNLVLQDIKSRFYTTDFLLRKNRYASRILKTVFSALQKKDSRSEGSELPVGVGYFLFQSDLSSQQKSTPLIHASKIFLKNQDHDQNFIDSILQKIKSQIVDQLHESIEIWVESPIIEFNLLFFRSLSEALKIEFKDKTISTNFDQILTGWHPQLAIAHALQRKSDRQLICILLIHSEKDTDLFFLG